MTPGFSGHFSRFGLVFFVLKSLLRIARQWILEKFAILTLKPRCHVRISIYRTWAIPDRTLRRFSILKMVWNFLYIINLLKSKMLSSATVTLQEVLLLYLRTQRIVVRISAFSCGRSQDTIHPPLQASSSIHSTAAIWMTCRSPVENKMIFLISYLFSYCKLRHKNPVFSSSFITLSRLSTRSLAGSPFLSSNVKA